MALTNLEVDCLRLHVQHFLDTFGDWAVIATDEEANYGSGLCADASADLVTYLEHEHAGEVRWLGPGRATFPTVDPHPDYPEDAHRAHAVAVFDDWVVDLTARQFDPSLPFPWFWRCP